MPKQIMSAYPDMMLHRKINRSKAVDQYFPPVKEVFENIKTTPKEFLLWFHHVAWNARLASGKILWEDLVAHYYSGIASVKQMRQIWETMQPKVDAERFAAEKHALAVQHEDAGLVEGCLLAILSNVFIPADSAQFE